MIRNLLYSISLHLLLFSLVYFGFKSSHIADFDVSAPIAVSIAQIKPVEIKKPKIEKKKPKVKKNIAKKKKVIKKKKTIAGKKSKKKQNTNKPKENQKIAKKSKKKKIVQSKPKEKENDLAKILKESDRNDEDIEEQPLSTRQKFNMQMQIRRCYKSAIIESGEISSIAIKIKASLQRNGVVDTDSIEILNESDYQDNQQELNISLNNAKRALEICSPIRNLPRDKYDAWRKIELVFDP